VTRSPDFFIPFHYSLDALSLSPLPICHFSLSLTFPLLPPSSPFSTPFTLCQHLRRIEPLASAHSSNLSPQPLRYSRRLSHLLLDPPFDAPPAPFLPSFFIPFLPLIYFFFTTFSVYLVFLTELFFVLRSFPLLFAPAYEPSLYDASNGLEVPAACCVLAVTSAADIIHRTVSLTPSRSDKQPRMPSTLCPATLRARSLDPHTGCRSPQRA